MTAVSVTDGSPLPGVPDSEVPALDRRSSGSLFRAVAFAFLIVMAVATLPSPLYGLYRIRDHLSALTITVVFAIFAGSTIASISARVRRSTPDPNCRATERGPAALRSEGGDGMDDDLGGSFALGPWCVRRAGYGAMQLAGDGVFGPPRDRAEAVRVLRAAVEAGVDHVDTAQFYGAGTVNELIREALRPYPDGLAIVSKVASRPGSDGASRRYVDQDHLREGIEENLDTLGVSRLAAVNLRMIDPDEAPGERFDAELAALIKARQEGLIDGIGLSNVSRQQLLRAVDQTEIVCVQNLFNLVDQGSADVLAECAKRGIAFVPFCPLGLPGAARNYLLTSPVLAALGARLHATPAQIALAWLLGLAPNILLIPGTRTRGHLAENLAAADVSLDAAAVAQLTRNFPAPDRRRRS